MRKTFKTLIALFLSLAGLAFAQDYSGTYVLSSQGVTVTLSLHQDAQGKITGTLSSTKGTQFQVEGVVEEGVAVGLCSSEQGAVNFEAQLQGNTLRLTMIEMGADTSKILEFVKQGTAGPTGESAGRNPLTTPGASSPAQNPLVQKAPTDAFVGIFVGPDLTLSLQSLNGKYTGTINFSGQTFPATAQKKGPNSIEGRFESGGTAFSFTAALENNVMKFSTEGSAYTLRKQSGGQPAPSQQPNPLQKRTQGAQPAERRAGGISDEQMGISFTPPSGWKAQKQTNGYLLGSDTYKGFIIIMPHNYSSLQQMSNEAQGGIVDEESGIQLQPVGGFEPVGKNGLAVEFSGMAQGREARAYAIGLISPNGGGVTILAATETGSYTSVYPQFVRSIASSLTFIRPQPQADASDTSLMKYFAGKYYSYSSGSTMYGSAGTERQVMLCPDGQFYDSSEFSASGGGEGLNWGGANSQGGAARWSIQGNKSQGSITIVRPNGKTERVQYQVTGEGGVILFNGIKFAYAGAPECR